MNILVTGGAGFIGSNLVHQLAQTKARVTILDNLVNGKSQNIQSEKGAEMKVHVNVGYTLFVSLRALTPIQLQFRCC